MLFLGKADIETIKFLSERNQLTAVFTKMNDKNLIENSVHNARVLFAESFKEIKDEFDEVIVFQEDFMGKDTIEFLKTAGEKTKIKGKIYFIGKTSRGAKNYGKKMNELFGNSEVVSIKGGTRLISSVKEKQIIKQEKKLSSFEFSLRKNKYFFSSTTGVFSKNRVDKGTKLLLDNLKEIKEKKILDFGCGIGVIGLVLAKENPEAKVLLIDSDSKAVNLSKKNIELNKVKNAKAIVSDGFENVKEKFDLIASNPPTHEKRDFLEKFVSEARKKLNKKGKLIIVLNKAVFLEKELNQVFGNCEIVAEGKEHKVIEAVKK